ncbi:hypothetical protein KSP35_10410 [Aquihabitans sp. G128]|uniref:hypothetical protein n=1 Tax=Aquihabitans sp. G128 TaxID=2849779 RepID=UPI001C2160F3|nr:hypothetical protein [Aquihabitans sp. G128]QXC63153.1 hypothetical protein KSP35_10410 [Aquihabitans sp. G128]
MATRICPDCGAQYVATVRRCIDCDVVLVDEVAPAAEGEAAASTAEPVGDGDQVGYELDGWGNQLKVTLEGMLDRAGVPRAWEAGALVVAARDEAVVDDLIATLEGGDVAELDDDVPRVALEIEGLDADGHADLDARLLAQAVPHAWDDDGALLVAEADEEQVLAIIEEALDHDLVEADDGLAAQQALSDLYVAVDKLAKGPDERKPATAYVRAAAALDGLAVPYGFGLDDWSSLTAEASALADLVAVHADPLPTADAEPGEDDDANDDIDDANDAVAADEVGADDTEDELDAEAAEVATPDADDDAGDGDDGVDGAGDVDDEDDGEERLEQARAAARALRARLVDLV